MTTEFRVPLCGSDGRRLELTQQDGVASLRADGNFPVCAEQLSAAAQVLWEHGVRRETAIVCDGERHEVLFSACGGVLDHITVHVGRASLVPREIPIRFEVPLVDDTVYLQNAPPVRLTALRFSEPYAVLFAETAGDCRLFRFAEQIAALPLYPQGAKVVFCNVREREARASVWAFRGGEARAVNCTDLCACLAASVATGRWLAHRTLSATLPIGEVRAVCADGMSVWLTIPVSGRTA